MNLDEELTIRESPWRGRLITMGVLAIVATVVGVLIYAFFFRPSSVKTRPTEDIQVGRATINANLVVSGTADAQLISDLSFRTSGRVDTVGVKVGDVVHKGDVLASLESADLDNGIASARAGLGQAQARLDNLVEGATAAELASADQQVVSAQAAADNADRDVTKVLDGPTEAEMSGQEQAVVTAQTALNQAQRNKQTLLDGPTAAQVASANQVATSAQVALDQALRDRQTLLDGPTAAQLTAADQGVISAQSGLNQAQRALDDLRDGPSQAELASAQQGVSAARANVDSAQANLDRVTEGPTNAQLTAAQAQVAAATQGLASARTGLDNARSSVASAEAGLRAAKASYCMGAPDDGLCGSSNIPLSDGTVNDLLNKLSDTATDPALLDDISALIQRNASYETAVNAVHSAEQAELAAESSVTAAQAGLDALRAPPNESDVRAAQAAVAAAQENLALAQLRLNDLRAQPEANDVANAEDAVRAAQAALDAANANRNDLRDGPDASDVARADDNLRSAQAVRDAAVAQRDDLVSPPDADDIASADDNIRSAQAALDAASAKLAALQSEPKQRDVASAQDAGLSAHAGLNAAIANQAQARRGPKATEIEQQRQAVLAAQLSVQAAQIRLRDTQILSPFEGTVAAVNIMPGEFHGPAEATPSVVLLTPNALVLKLQLGETDYPNVKLDQTGVVLFDALPGKPFPFKVAELGLNPTVTSGVVTYEVTGALDVPADGPRPAPGMSGNGQIITDSHPNVVAIPPRAIRRKGADQIVDLRRNGTVEEQVIATGLTDTNNVEILSGLQEGDTLVVPVLVTGSSSGPAKRPTLPAGIR
jgi:RND family efflux transporter MFP subunit